MAMVFQNASKTDLPALKTLWSEAFPKDLPESRDGFFENLFDPARAFTAREKGKPVAALYYLPAELRLKNIRYPVGYLYGLSTATPYRGQGLMRRLEEMACQQAEAEGLSALTLVLQDPTLLSFYRRLGYHPLAGRGETVVCSTAATDRLTPCLKAEFTAMREVWTKKQADLLSLTGRAQDYLYDFSKLWGQIYRYRSGYLVAEPRGKTLVIRETDLSYPDLCAGAGLLLQVYPDCRRVVWQSRFGRQTPHAMIKWLDGMVPAAHSPTVSLMLD